MQKPTPWMPWQCTKNFTHRMALLTPCGDLTSLLCHTTECSSDGEHNHITRQQCLTPIVLHHTKSALAREVSAGAHGFHTSSGPAESTHPKFRFPPYSRPGTMIHLCICLKDFTVDQSKVSLLTTVNFGMQKMPG